MGIHSNCHSVYQLTYHAVFVVKYRKRIITPEMMCLMRDHVSNLICNQGGSLLDLNGEPDRDFLGHTRLLISKISVSFCSNSS